MFTFSLKFSFAFQWWCSALPHSDHWDQHAPRPGPRVQPRLQAPYPVQLPHPTTNECYDTGVLQCAATGKILLLQPVVEFSGSFVVCLHGLHLSSRFCVDQIISVVHAKYDLNMQVTDEFKLYCIMMNMTIYIFFVFCLMLFETRCAYEELCPLKQESGKGHFSAKYINLQLKVTSSLTLVSFGNAYLGKYISHMKSLSLRMNKVKVVNRQRKIVCPQLCNSGDKNHSKLRIRIY